MFPIGCHTSVMMSSCTYSSTCEKSCRRSRNKIGVLALSDPDTPLFVLATIISFLALVRIAMTMRETFRNTAQLCRTRVWTHFHRRFANPQLCALLRPSVPSCDRISKIMRLHNISLRSTFPVYHIHVYMYVGCAVVERVVGWRFTQFRLKLAQPLSVE